MPCMFHSVLVAIVAQEAIGASLLRKEDPNDSLYESAVDVDATDAATTDESLSSGLLEVVSGRMSLIEEAYGGHDSFDDVQDGMYSRQIAADESLDQLLSKADSWVESPENATKEGHTAGIYGEIKPVGMLKMLRTVSAQPREVFMDLGSGTGKFSIIASQIFGMHAKGIELVPTRYSSGCKALKKLRDLTSVQKDNDWSSYMPQGSVQLVRGSFFDYDISDADVIFMDSVEWNKDMMKHLGEMCQGLKPGSRVMTFQDLPAEGFVEEGTIGVPVTWDKEDNEWKIYRKIGEQNKAALLKKSSLLDSEMTCAS